MFEMERIEAGTSVTDFDFEVDTRTDTFRKYYQHKEACDRLESALYNDLINAKREFDRSFDKLIRAETALNQFRQKKADTGTLLSELLKGKQRNPGRVNPSRYATGILHPNKRPTPI